MNRLINFFRGTIRLEITGVEPQRCLNHFLKNGVSFFEIAPQDDYCIQCTILKSALDAAEQSARSSMCELTYLQRHGFAQVFYGLLKRPVLLAMTVLLAISIVVLPNFIWTLEVEGNVDIPSEQILQELESIGIHFGTWIPSISNQEVKNQMLLKIPQLQWLAVNCSGGKATVMVSERSYGEATVSKRQVTNLVASRDGVVVDMSVLNGFAICKPGQAVKEGDLLVSGYADWEHCIQATRSLGEVYALTMHKVSAVLPSKIEEKQKTGEKAHCIYLTIGRKRIKIFGSSGISVSDCDKIVSEKTLTLPGGYTLPISIAVETYEYCQSVSAEVTEDTAWELLRDGTDRQIWTSMIAGQRQSAREEKLQTDGAYILHTTAWCKEMIARSENATIFTEEDNDGTDNQRRTN